MTTWTSAQIEAALSWAYTRILDGSGGLETAAVIAESHHRPVQTSLQLADEIVGWQLARMSVPLFFEQLVLQLGVPSTLPTALATTLFLEVRMAAAIAYGAGRELDDPRVRAAVLSCLMVEDQGAALAAAGLDPALVLTRAAMRTVPDTVVEPLERSTVAWLVRACETGGVLASARVSMEAPWASDQRAKAIGATARDRFMVLRHW